MKRITLLVIGLLSAVLMSACAAPAAESVVETVVVEAEGETIVERVVVEQETAGEALAPAADDGAESLDYDAAEVDALEEEEPAQPEAAPTDMFFEDYGTNPFVATEEDALSTFAIDVDTGSYTLTRSYLNDGYLPPADAIRLEEFVNYFDQDYPVPQDDAFSINMTAAPAPFAPEGNIVMRVGVQGFDVPPDQRPDANLVFVIDVSGSMSGPERLGAVRSALNTLVDELRPTDQVGIIVYGSRGRTLLEMTPVSRQRNISRAINQLQSEGSTNAEEGLRLAYEMATANFDENRINRIILLSDGVANVGLTGPDGILEVAREQAREGITLSTVGFGMGNYNDTLMEQLANDGDGQYFYVDSANEANRVFVEDLTGTLLTIAMDAKIQVEFNPNTVQAYRLMGYENRAVADDDFRNDEVDAGEIGAGHTVTALYEVVPLPNAQGTLATARLRWEDPETGSVTELEQSMTTEEVLPTFDEAPATFQVSVLAAAFADILGEGAWSQSADMQTLYALAEAAAEQRPQDDKLAEFMSLVAIATDLQR